jgi:hypothetical protein
MMQSRSELPTFCFCMQKQWAENNKHDDSEDNPNRGDNDTRRGQTSRQSFSRKLATRHNTQHKAEDVETPQAGEHQTHGRKCSASETSISATLSRNGE